MASKSKLEKENEVLRSSFARSSSQNKKLRAQLEVLKAQNKTTKDMSQRKSASPEIIPTSAVLPGTEQVKKDLLRTAIISSIAFAVILTLALYPNLY